MAIQVLFNIFRGVSTFLQIIELAIIGYMLGSWFLSPTNRLYVLLQNFSAPFIAPFRPLAMKLMMRTGLRLDLSGLMALFALRILGDLAWRLFGLISQWL